MENGGCCVYITVFVVLFLLKLIGVITWSWWWIITAPLWLPIAVPIITIFLVILAAPLILVLATISD